MAYVIAQRGRDYLDSPVFHAGATGQEEAIAVFTSVDLAQKYIDDAGWADEHQAGLLDELQLLRWVVRAHEQGTQYVVINPNRTAQMAGEAQQVVAIEEKLAAFAEALTREISELTSREQQT